MNTQHTPGPWVLEHENHSIADTGDYDGYSFIKAANGKLITDWYGGLEEGEGDANGALIAAAPDLLASLIEITGVLDALLIVKSEPEEGSIGGRARNAIAKATEGAA